PREPAGARRGCEGALKRAVEFRLMRKSPIKIATAQCAISPELRANGREIRALMRQAHAGGAAIVHFPEAAMSGCSKAHIKSWDGFDWDVLVDELRLTAKLAGELGLWVVVGRAP